MSQFDAYTQAGYVAKLCNFLGKQHPAVQSIKMQRSSEGNGRPPKLSQGRVAALEHAVNVVAARCEATDGSIRERIVLAKGYRGFNGAELARRMGVTREAVRRWCAGISQPGNVERLAAVLDVPVCWLEFGGGWWLPANSPLGVRVGAESEAARKRLHQLTLDWIQASEGISSEEKMAGIEQAVFEEKGFAVLARQAGGRWHPQGRTLIFVPWHCLAPRSLARRFWDDEVEAIIRDAMATRHSVYSAWFEVKRRAEEKGLRYPALISLYKRAEKYKAHCRRFGVDSSNVLVGG